jgi:hypothetical protein
MSAIVTSFSKAYMSRSTTPASLGLSFRNESENFVEAWQWLLSPNQAPPLSSRTLPENEFIA